MGVHFTFEFNLGDRRRQADPTRKLSDVIFSRFSIDLDMSHHQISITSQRIEPRNSWSELPSGLPLRNYFRQRTKIWNHWFITTANGTTNWILKWTRLEFTSRTWFRIKGWDFTKWLLCNNYVIKFWNSKNRNWRNKRHETSNGMFTKRKCVFTRRNWYSKRARKP